MAGASPEPAQTPADVIISGARREGLAVTIAAASTDLRDRFRAAAGDLRQDLSLLGTEVDSIRVALRNDLSADASGSGQSGQSEKGSGSPADAARGTDIMWQDWRAEAARDMREPVPTDYAGAGPADPSVADPAPEAARDSEAAFADQPSSGGRQPGSSSTAPDERFRFTLSAGVAAQPRTSPADQVTAPDTTTSHRIDRYA